MYTFEIVPKSYVFDSYFNLYVESVSAPVNVYLLNPSKVREGAVEYPGKLSEGVILPELISVFLLPISSPMVSLWNLK